MSREIIFKSTDKWVGETPPTTQEISDHFRNEFMELVLDNPEISDEIKGDGILTDVYYEADTIGVEIYKIK
jgi:hypothetical protein